MAIDWMEVLTWKCHVCGAERPDEFISVHKKEVMLGNGIRCQFNVRFCNDKRECIDGAPGVDFTKRPMNER